VRDAGFQLAQARLLVAAKIRNQRRVLQRLASERGGMAAGALSWLKNMVRQCEDCASIESLRGIEGAAAGRYFEAIGPFFPPQTPFKGRNKRPPRDPANALLSFIYTILTAELALHARAHGLEAGWGCYHAMEDGRPSLALDLVEPFRAPIADALALDLLNHGRLGPDDFETTPDGACLLRRASRRRLFAALEERLERQFSHRQSDERTTLRQIFKQQARAFRLACRQREPFSPFLMN
jgi:CRISPR-associated endonuclease Cas1